MADPAEAQGALAELDALVKAGTISADRAAFLSSKYMKAHALALQLVESEKRLLNSAKEKAQQLADDKSAADNFVSNASQAQRQITALQIEFSKHEGALALATERISALAQEEATLGAERLHYKRIIDEMEAAKKAELAPVIAANQKEVNELKAAVEGSNTALRELAQTANELRGRMKATKAARDKCGNMVAAAQTEVAQLARRPPALSKQNAVVQSLLDGVSSNMDRLRDDYSRVDAKSVKERAVVAKLEAKLDDLVSAKARSDDEVASLEARVSRMQRRLEAARGEGDDAVSEFQRLELDVARAAANERRARDALQRAELSRERSGYACRSVMERISELKSEIETLTRAQELATSDLKRAGDAARSAKRALKKADEEAILAFAGQLRAEEAAKKAEADANASYKDLITLQSESNEIHGQLQELRRKATEHRQARERAAAASCEAAAGLRAAMESLEQKDAIAINLAKRQAEVNKQLEKFAGVFDAMKQQRNGFTQLVTAAQASKQALIGSLATLEDELKTVGSELHMKESAREVEARACSESLSVLRRDQSQVAEARTTLASLLEEVRRGVSKIEDLGRIVHSAEEKLGSLKEDYAVQSDVRNRRGLELLTRNEELAVLYARSGALDKEALEAQKDADSADALVAELERTAGELERRVARCALENTAIEKLEQQKADLQRELTAERDELSRVGAQMSDPATKPWREVALKAANEAEPAELRRKASDLQQHLNKRVEQVMERQLVLDELTSLGELLRGDAEARRSAITETATKLSNAQGELAHVNRKLKAAVAELALYQGRAVELEARRLELQKAVDDGAVRAAGGREPFAGAAREFKLNERRKQVRRQIAAEAAERDLADPKHLEPGAVATTAEGRPNAYVPNEDDPMSLDLPKPYGAYAPYKPTPLGTTFLSQLPPDVRSAKLKQLTFVTQ